MSRKVLCLPKTNGTHSGEEWTPPEDLNELLSLCIWHDKADAEINPDYRQIIPYIIVKNPDGDVLSYPRNGSEKRLHSLNSIGVGGHVEESDAEGVDESVMSREMGAFMQCVVREAKEELGISGCPFKMINGYLLLDNTLVDQVHMGIIFTTTVEFDDPQKTDEIPFFEWVHPVALAQTIESYEAWSQEVIVRLLQLGSGSRQHGCKKGGCCRR